LRLLPHGKWHASGDHARRGHNAQPFHGDTRDKRVPHPPAATDDSPSLWQWRRVPARDWVSTCSAVGGELTGIGAGLHSTPTPDLLMLSRVQMIAPNLQQNRLTSTPAPGSVAEIADRVRTVLPVCRCSPTRRSSCLAHRKTRLPRLFDRLKTSTQISGLRVRQIDCISASRSGLSQATSMAFTPSEVDSGHSVSACPRGRRFFNRYPISSWRLP
jgi:hypothetical protein